MTVELFTYTVANNSTPFSTIPGGFANFSFQSCLESQPMEKSTPSNAPVTQITWVLRDRFTNEVFNARQDISTDHAALYASLVSERPLVNNHVYETLRVSTPKGRTKYIHPPTAPARETEHRNGVARGTHIMTARGEIPVERLRIGDRVITRDHGMQPIRWIGTTCITVTPKNAPVVFKSGALKNSRDLVVSADHRVVLKGTDAMMQYGVKEVLIPARKLVNGSTIVQAVSGEMEYFQILTDQHEVIYTEAAAAESFMPNAAALSKLDSTARNEVFQAFPSLAKSPESYRPCARAFAEADAP